MFKPVIVSRHKDVAHDIGIWQGDVEKFDQDESREIVFVVTPPKDQLVGGLMQELFQAGYHVEKLPDGNVYIVTSRVQVPKEFSIYHPPFVGSRKCAPSPPSNALYHLQYCVGNCGILWQRLERAIRSNFAQTSSHFHKKQSEKWLVLSGSGTLWSRNHDNLEELWRATPMNKGDCLEVEPKTEHQLRTDSNFSTLLVMTAQEDDFFSDGFSARDHFYVEPPPADMAVA